MARRTCHPLSRILNDFIGGGLGCRNVYPKDSDQPSHSKPLYIFPSIHGRKAEPLNIHALITLFLAFQTWCSSGLAFQLLSIRPIPSHPCLEGQRVSLLSCWRSPASGFYDSPPDMDASGYEVGFEQAQGHNDLLFSVRRLPLVHAVASPAGLPIAEGRLERCPLG